MAQYASPAAFAAAVRASTFAKDDRTRDYASARGARQSTAFRVPFENILSEPGHYLNLPESHQHNLNALIGL